MATSPKLPSFRGVAIPGGTEIVSPATRLYAPSGDFAEPAYAARTSHWATVVKLEAGALGCIGGIGDYGDKRAVWVSQRRG
jgi:hypothetical protein